MDEVWKIILSTINYEASSLGKIRRVGNYHPMRETISKQGYARVNICIHGRQHTKKVATLVAEAFIGERPPEHHVHHKDGDMLNDAPDNLEYLCRWKHYTTFTRCSGTMHGNHRLSDIDVCMMRDMYPSKSMFELSDLYGVKYNTVYKIVTRRSWVHI